MRVVSVILQRPQIEKTANNRRLSLSRTELIKKNKISCALIPTGELEKARNQNNNNM